MKPPSTGFFMKIVLFFFIVTKMCCASEQEGIQNENQNLPQIEEEIARKEEEKERVHRKTAHQLEQTEHNMRMSLNSTTTATPPTDETKKKFPWYFLLMIAIGCVIAALVIAVFIFCHCSQEKQPVLPPIPVTPPPDAALAPLVYNPDSLSPVSSSPNQEPHPSRIPSSQEPHPSNNLEPSPLPHSPELEPAEDEEQFPSKQDASSSSSAGSEGQKPPDINVKPPLPHPRSPNHSDKQRNQSSYHGVDQSSYHGLDLSSYHTWQTNDDQSS